MHGKGSFAVQDSMTHDKGLGHDNTVRRCRGVFISRALISLFAVLAIFAVRWSMPLPCELLRCVLVHVFTVRGWFAVRRCGLSRQSRGRRTAQFCCTATYVFPVVIVDKPDFF
jgi:hypothetical protein